MKKKRLYLLTCLFISCSINAQNLKSGFSKQEYIDLMKASAQFGDSTYIASLPPPAGWKLSYRSPAMGLDNKWDLWETSTGAEVISIRGTTVKEASWMANFYAAMVPAKGELKLSETESFQYNLTDNPAAAVHVGWLVATGYLSKDILSKIDSGYKAGRKDFYILGHSQGGAIAFILTAHLKQLQKQGKLQSDIQFKTYCSAGPKPGNLSFAYEYEAMTQNGWAFNVVNAADWVPQTPFSVQTVDDLPEINPFGNAKTFIRKQSLPKRWILNYAYGEMTKPAKRAAKNYQKYLGKFVSKSVVKNLEGFESPEYFDSNYYVRTGNTIVLLPKPDYYQKYPQDKSKIFLNHFHPPYLYLAEQLKAN